MAFNRVLIPDEYAKGDHLTSDLVGLGMRFGSSPPKNEPNIEDTIVAASLEGVGGEDYRLLSLLVDWFGIHLERVNIDRLTKSVQFLEDKRVKAFWAGLAQWQKQDWRLKRLQEFQLKPRIDLMKDGTSFQIERHGEDPRFKDTVLRIPSKLLRHRPTDILQPCDLAKLHRAYYFRTMLGPSYRADMWAVVERNPDLTPAEIARRTYGSFPTAWEVRRDWLILNPGRVLKTA